MITILEVSYKSRAGIGSLHSLIVKALREIEVISQRFDKLPRMKLLFLLLSIVSYVQFSHAASDICTVGQQQSPIALVTETAEYSRQLSKLTLRALEDISNVSVTATNTGRAVVLSLRKKASIKKTYDLTKIKFHWGNDSHRGSEHTVDGQRFSGEMEYFFEDPEGNTPSTTYPPDHPGYGFPQDFTKVIVSLFLTELEALPQDHGFFQQLKMQLPHLIEPGSSVTYDTDMGAMEYAFNDMFHYKGSLSSFPCYEGIDRYVHAIPFPVTSGFLQALRSLKNSEGQPLVDNYRELQPLNGRRVQRS